MYYSRRIWGHQFVIYLVVGKMNASFRFKRLEMMLVCYRFKVPCDRLVWLLQKV
jgi:hypothetical protein